MKSRVEEIYQYTWTCEFCGKESTDDREIIVCEKEHKEKLNLEEKFKTVDSMTSFLTVLKEINSTIEITFTQMKCMNNVIFGNVSFCVHDRMGDNIHNFIEVILEPYGFYIGTGGGGYNGNKEEYRLSYDFTFKLSGFPKLKKVVDKYLDVQEQEKNHNIKYANYDYAKQNYIINCLKKDKSFQKVFKTFKEAEALFNKVHSATVEKYNLKYIAANPEPELSGLSSNDLYHEIF